MKNTISLKDVLDLLDTGKEFDSIEFVTRDNHKDTGGEWVRIEGGRARKWMSSQEYRQQQLLQPRTRGIKKPPRHYENSTRNVITRGGHIRKIHIRLIRKFNDKTVL